MEGDSIRYTHLTVEQLIQLVQEQAIVQILERKLTLGRVTVKTITIRFD